MMYSMIFITQESCWWVPVWVLAVSSCLFTIRGSSPRFIQQHPAKYRKVISKDETCPGVKTTTVSSLWIYLVLTRVFLFQEKLAPYDLARGTLTFFSSTWNSQPVWTKEKKSHLVRWPRSTNPSTLRLYCFTPRPPIPPLYCHIRSLHCKIPSLDAPDSFTPLHWSFTSLHWFYRSL